MDEQQSTETDQQTPEPEVSEERARRPKKRKPKRVEFSTFAESGCEGCLVGCLVMPIIIQVYWVIDTAKAGKLRFSIAEILAFVTLFAVCLSYEVSIAPRWLGMPQQLLLAMPLVLLFGAVPSFLFKNPRWIVVSLDMIVIMETIAFVIWWRS